MRLPLWRIAEFIAAAGGVCDREAVAGGYSIDSRTIRPAELFFALQGERMDGHDFVASALEKGAVAAVVRKDQASRYSATPQVLAVDDTLLALQTLARAVRKLWGKTLVGVTGSAGKTTTKEAIAHVLASRFRVLKSEGNLNNHFGLPLQLLRLEPEHEVAVIEMGMNHAGEIAALCRIAGPNLGVVTNVAAVHLGFFDSVAGIARAKYELVEALPPHGTAVLNADDEYVSQFSRDFPGKVVMFGIEKPADVRAQDITQRGAEGSKFDLTLEGAREPVALPLLGRHNIYNALAAAAVAVDRGMAPGDIARALATLQPAEKRGQVLELAGATVVNDCYNSNPKALDSMVDALASLPAKRRILVAGEMLELGAAGDELHYRCGVHAAQRRIDIVIGVRGAARRIVAGASDGGVSSEFLDTPEEAGDWLAAGVRAGDAVLLKASRGVKLERALERWQAAWSGASTEKK